VQCSIGVGGKMGAEAWCTVRVLRVRAIQLVDLVAWQADIVAN